MRLLRGVILAAWALIWPALAGAECTIDDDTLWQGLNESMWINPAPQQNAPVVYVVTGIWCPPCKKIVRLALERRYNINFRFIFVEPISPLVRDQHAQIVAEGAPALQRFANNPMARPTPPPPEFVAAVSESGQITYSGIRQKLAWLKDHNIRQGLPTLLFRGPDQAVIPMFGGGDYALVAAEAHRSTRVSDRSFAPIIDQVRQGWGEIANRDVVNVISPDTLVTPFPGRGVPFCLGQTGGYDTTHEVTLDGTRYMRFQAHISRFIASGGTLISSGYVAVE